MIDQSDFEEIGFDTENDDRAGSTFPTDYGDAAVLSESEQAYVKELRRTVVDRGAMGQLGLD